MTAYIIGRMNISNESAYNEFSERARPIVEQYGGRFLVRGGTCITLEGREFVRNVIVEFDSVEQAVALYNSPEYREAWQLQKGAAERDVVVVQGI